MSKGFYPVSTDDSIRSETPNHSLRLAVAFEDCEGFYSVRLRVQSSPFSFLENPVYVIYSVR